MERRTVRLLGLAALLLSPPAHAQAGAARQPTLAAFGSRAELSAYMAALARQADSIENARRQLAASAGPGPACPAQAALPADSAHASAVLRGTVTGPDGAPMEGALVRTCAVGGSIGAVTAADGTYQLVIPSARIPATRRVRVTVSRIGSTGTTREVAVAPGDTAQAGFALESSALALQSVVVTGASTALAGRAAGVSVTNVQTAGVDEGGIVKVHGQYLVMLRRGRLFTVAIGDRRLRPVSAVDAFAPGMDPGGAWYDEMLIHGDRVVVIGYSYRSRGTEINLFDIDRAGRLRYNSTYHLRSNDYYSSRNYASRLAGGKLIFYTPSMVPAGDTTGAWIPALSRWSRGDGRDEFTPILPPARIYRPGRALGPTRWLTLHTVTSCDLESPEMRCTATAVLGPSGRVFYVSGGSVYVWVTGGWRGESQASMVYRLPLDGAAPTALGVSGSPVDQFSFLEDDGYLNVLVRSRAAGDGMWRAERARGDVALLRVPLGRFGNGGADAPDSAYRDLPGNVEGYAFANRFVGRHLLYGGGSRWGRPDRSGGWTLYATTITGGPVAEVKLPHGVDRIEVMGPGAVVVGTDGLDLHFTGISLGGEPRVQQRYVSRNASQGELRSHGFYYQPEDEEGRRGMIGLPIRAGGRPGYEHLYNESASVLFLRNYGNGFRALGELESHAEGGGEDEGGDATDGCVASCVDWYGNSRPLFVDGRVFALLGYELVEGQVMAGRIRELRRVSFAPRPVQAAAR
ncbi:MAG TPA: beta-propeller domain-containing protein [Longimicrobium sp.]|nr:beta-propeller domain-containing protein [Longimicrobium sp.]